MHFEKYYILKPNYQEYTLYDNHIILDGCWMAEHNEILNLTDNDFALILDSLYEQASFQKHTKGGNKVYAKECIKLAKKLSKFWKEKT